MMSVHSDSGTGQRPTAVMLMLVLAMLPLSALAGIKCWTNAEGVRECGNVVPPEYAQQGHEERSKRGFTTDVTNKAKTVEEVETERLAREAAEASAAKQAAEAKKQAEIDHVLLATFASEDDINMAREGQLANVESQIKITREHIKKLDESLDGMIATAAEQEKRGHEVSADLRKGIEETRRQIEDESTFIKNRLEEGEKIKAKFEADLARFRELRAAR